MAHTRLLSSHKLDDYVPQADLCMVCKNELEVSTAHFGRIITGWSDSRRETVTHKFHNGAIHTIPMVTDLFFPRKVTGLCCPDCYTTLYNQTYHDRNGHLRRAFETVHPKVEQPKGDDHEASPITKGLYAPHVVKGKGRRKADYYENATDSSNSVVIDERQLPRNPEDDRKLQGFNRFEREDIKIDHTKRKVIAKRGVWKVDPARYDYKAPEQGPKVKLPKRPRAPKFELPRVKVDKL